MKIIEKSYAFKSMPSNRLRTDYIVLHHMAANGSADDVHRAHLANGWAGIGYHFFVRSDGRVYRGRPISKVGAHTQGYNSQSVGVCFEGNFETEHMSQAQLQSGRELVAYLKGIYPMAQVKKHGSFSFTACPGKNFPFDAITSVLTELTDAQDIVAYLSNSGIITDSALWNEKLKENTNAYWLARKIANKTKKSAEPRRNLVTVNDIVWELAERGIITDKALWLRLFEADKDLYWLGYKAANLTEER